MDDMLEEAYPITKEDLEGLVNKGLIKLMGYDPLGRPVYANTDLGNAVADELERTEGAKHARSKRKARLRR